MVRTGMNKSAAGAATAREIASSDPEQRAAQVLLALRALFHLLEKHAPVWYTVEYHQKAETAISIEPQQSPKIFIELFDLLEAYAPLWYTEQDQKRASEARRLLK